MVRGQVAVAFNVVSEVLPHVRSGRIRALAITSSTRSPRLPDVPTVAQAGAPYLEMVTWGGIVGPKGMPPAIVKKLNTTMNEILADPNFKKQYEAMGSETDIKTPEQFAAMITVGGAGAAGLRFSHRRR